MNNLISEFQWNNTYTMYIILGVFLVIMIVMTIIPQRKQKKKQEAMMNSIQVGDKIMTIGGIIGTIVEYDAGSDQYTINVGTEEEQTLMKIVKNAIRTKL